MKAKKEWSLFDYRIRELPDKTFSVEKDQKIIASGILDKSEVVSAIDTDLIADPNFSFGAWPYQNNFSSFQEPVIEDQIIEISELACKKLFYYASATDLEVSGLGTMERIVRKSYRKYIITDVFLFKQKSSIASTSLSKEAIAQFVADWIRAGRDPSNLRCWFHSHADGSVFWSSTDEDTCDAFESDDYMVSIVVNRRHEMLGRVDLYNPRIRVAQIQPVVRFNLDKDLKRRCKEEVDKKNKRRVYAFSKSYKGLLKADGYLQPQGFSAYY